MRSIFISLFIAVLLVGLVQAQEASKYNFGSMQPAKELNIVPGEEITTRLYFYNIYGNRITHIKLNVIEAPKNWDVKIEPEVHDTKIEVAGVKTVVNENLYVEPSKASDEIPEDFQEGTEYIQSKVGLIRANFAEIKIKAPEDEEIGKDFYLKIEASAFWLGQAGNVDVQQGRDFEYKITTISEEFYERIIEEEIEPEALDKITGAVVKDVLKSNMAIKVLTVGLIILVGITAVLVFIKKKPL